MIAPAARSRETISASSTTVRPANASDPAVPGNPIA